MSTKEEINPSSGASREPQDSASSDEELDESGEFNGSSDDSNVEDTDDLHSIKPKVDVPKNVKADSTIVSLDCHPKRNFVASATIDGPVFVHIFREDSTDELMMLEMHKKSCRAVKFSANGQYLYSGSEDTVISIYDMEGGRVHRKFSRKNGSPIYSLCPINEFTMATGCDDGEVVYWDTRVQQPIEVFQDCTDYISSLTLHSDKKMLVATSGDGTMAVYNVKNQKLEMRSEQFDADLLCGGIFKGGSKLVVGSGDGSLNIFNWMEFSNISDRFPGHPGCVDALVVLEDDVVITGCEDGKLRAVQLFPNRFLGVLGDHDGFGVEGLSLTFNKKFVVSCSYDNELRFWDLSGIEEAKLADVKDTKKKHQQLNKQVDNFFEDI